MEHGLKYFAFYIQKLIAHRIVCYNVPLVCDKPLGAPLFVNLICYIIGKTISDSDLQWQHQLFINFNPVLASDMILA